MNEKIQAYNLKTPALADKYPFWIPQFGHTYKTEQYHMILHESDVTRIEYIVSGRSVVNSKDMSLIAESGDTYILHEGEYQNFYNDISMPMNKIWINVTGRFVKDIIDMYGLKDTILLKNTDSQKYIERIHRICLNSNDPYFIQEKVSMLFLNLIQFLSKKYKSTTKALTPMNTVKSYIDLHLEDDISMNDLAVLSNMCVEHTIRTFSSQFGITPHQYILKNKIELACSLLSSTNYSINDISERLKFYNSAHFSNTFFKYVGMRPSEYRNKSRISAE